MKCVCLTRGKSSPTTHFLMQRACVTTDTMFFVQSSAVRGMFSRKIAVQMSGILRVA